MWAGPTRKKNKKNISLLAGPWRPALVACLLADRLDYILLGAIACNDTGNVLGMTTLEPYE
jgi:hypothetical protein